MRKPFRNTDNAAKVFYSNIFYNVILNLNAVRLGYYDNLLCETDDPLAGVKWKESICDVITRMRNGPHQEY